MHFLLCVIRSSARAFIIRVSNNSVTAAAIFPHFHTVLCFTFVCIVARLPSSDPYCSQHLTVIIFTIIFGIVVRHHDRFFCIFDGIMSFAALDAEESKTIRKQKSFCFVSMAMSSMSCHYLFGKNHSRRLCHVAGSLWQRQQTTKHKMGVVAASDFFFWFPITFHIFFFAFFWFPVHGVRRAAEMEQQQQQQQQNSIYASKHISIMWLSDAHKFIVCMFTNAMLQELEQSLVFGV